MNDTLFRIIMLALVAAGIYLLAKTIGMLKKTFYGKMVAEIPFTQKQSSFQIPQQGIYAIWQKGQLGRRTLADKFKLKLSEQNSSREIELDTSWFQLYINGFDTARSEIKRFPADAGNYTLEIIETVPGSSPGRFIADSLPLKKVDEEQYFIQVRESQPVYYLFIAIPLLALSAFMIIIGTIAGIRGLQILVDFGII